MKTLQNIIRAMGIVGALLLLTDSLGYTETSIWFGVDAWKVMFALLTVWFCLGESDTILKSYLPESS